MASNERTWPEHWPGSCGHRRHRRRHRLALLSIGAVAFHLRASDRVADMVPTVIGIALGAATAVLHTF